MPDSLQISYLQLHHLAAGAAAGKLSLQTRMRFWLDAHYVPPTIARDLANVGSIGIQRIFNQDDRQILVALGQRLAQPFGGVALTIVLFRSVLSQDRLEIQWEDRPLFRIE